MSDQSLQVTRGHHASGPTQIPARGWKEILWRVKSEIASDHISVVAAGIAFYALASIFPAIGALISIAGLILNPADIADQLQTIMAMLPESAAGILQDQITQVTGGDETATGFVAVFGVILALYGAMKGVLTLMEGLNIAYDEEEARGTIRLYLVAFAITLCMILGLTAALGLIILLPSLVALGHLPSSLETLIGWLAWPLMAALMMLALAVLYRFGASRADPQWRWVSVGAVAATVLWILGTLGFSIYTQNFGSYTETYGALGGVIILLTWLWLSAFIVLFGAELNAEIEQQTARDTTTGAPKPIGQRQAIKADTLPPSASQGASEDQGEHKAVANTDLAQETAPRSAKDDLTMGAVLIGSALWKTIRKHRKTTESH